MRGRLGGLLVLLASATFGITAGVRADDTTTSTIAPGLDSTTTVETSTTVESTSTVESSTTAESSTTDAPMQPATRGSSIQETPISPPTTAAPTPVWSGPGVGPAPANSGTGRRAVYSKSRQRVWVIEADNTVVRTFLVSGRMSQPPVGTFAVFSRSAYTCSIADNGTCMRYMVRFTRGPSGDNIGFHEIPRDKYGKSLQSTSQLGQALSHGCVRESTPDAQFMWNWAGIGTKVVVIA